jgi:integrase
MSMGVLTDVRIRSWVKDENPIAGKSDGGGLTFTLSKAGRAAWVFRYRFAGAGCEVTLGNYPDMTLADARQRASKLRLDVQSGIDVAAEKRKAKFAHRQAQTFEDLAKQYLKVAGTQLKETSRTAVERYLSKDINPRIGRIAATDLVAADVINLIEQIAKRSQSVARRAFEMVSVILAFGVARQAVVRNVCGDLKISAILGEVKPRRPRIMLSEDELRVILPMLNALGRENALALKIILATCVRKSELIKARWEHIQNGHWTIPEENAKNKKSFVIPLAPTVIEWFEKLRVFSNESAFVLPARKRGYGRKSSTISPSTLNAALDRTPLGVRDFSPHDLRSTARSHLAASGVDVIVAERCLNHELGGLISVYDKHDYLDERRSVLERWARLLQQYESGEKRTATNVIALRA